MLQQQHSNYRIGKKPTHTMNRVVLVRYMSGDVRLDSTCKGSKWIKLSSMQEEPYVRAAQQRTIEYLAHN